MPHELLAGAVARIDDTFRGGYRWHGAIGAALGRHIWLGGATVIGTLRLGCRRGGASASLNGPGACARLSRRRMLLGMLLAYALVYLFSPYDLAWHLGTSANRVIVQLTRRQSGC